MRTWMIVAIVLVLVAGAILAASVINGGVPVEVAVARRGPIAEFIDERGKTRLPEVHSITMPYTARIEPITLIEGAEVYRGQIVAQVVPLDMKLSLDAATAAVERLEAAIRENDDASVERIGLQQSLSFVESMDRAVEAARARVEAGRAKRDYANRNFERIQRLYQQGARSEDELDQARVAQVQADVDYQQDVLVLRAMEAMQAATALMPSGIRQYIDRKDLTREVLEKQRVEALVHLKQVETDQQRGTMRSPVDGIVLARFYTDEQQVPAGTVLLTIGQLDLLEVEADLLSQDVVNVSVGDRVEISGPAVGPAPTRGVVDRIFPAGFTKISSLGVEQQRVKVVIRFDPEDLLRLRSERELGVDYRLRVRIFTDEKPDALVVPRSALFRSADGRWQVFAVRNGVARLEPVATGLMNDDEVEIISGLGVGDLVVLAPETRLTDGARVRALKREPIGSLPADVD
jgi:HlyD family secretion protein